MSRIRLLAEEVYKKIAAGEVIERPLSVVKELVENSIDAGADDIHVTAVAGGKELIRIDDNGHGFAADDIEIAFMRHSTSKLTALDDFNHLQTLGFRGEALASIAEVARLELRTSDNDAGSGIRTVLENGRVLESRAIARPRGTTLEVRDLFYNFPVRRKFMKSDTGELNLITQYLEQIALAYPEVAFTLEGNRKTVFQYGKVNTLAERIYQVFGKEFFADLQPLEYEDGVYAISGWVSRLQTGISAKNRQYFLVNRRPVREKTLVSAFNNAFQKYLEKGRSPVGVLHLKVAPCEVDVNIHPMKLEIRFRDAGGLYTAMMRAVEGCFRQAAEPEAALAEGRQWLSPPVTVEYSAAGRVAEPAFPSAPLFAAGETAPPPAFFETPAYSILGQFRRSYILVEKDGHLLIVDQHNAHERAIFERLQRSVGERRVPAAATLFPVVLELTPSERQALDETRLDILRRSGFEVDMLGEMTVQVKAFPTLLEERAIKDTLRAILALAPGEGADDDMVLATMACKSAVKVNHTLGIEQMRRIVADLFACENPLLCPHRRPIVIDLGPEEVEKRLKRR